MYSVDLGRLERVKKLAVDLEIPADDDLWAGGRGLDFETAVHFSGSAALLPGGIEVLVSGVVTGTQEQQCRRCLEAVPRSFELSTTWYFVPADELQGEDDGERRPIPEGFSELDIGVTLREELMLSLPQYALCRMDCAGLCPSCGSDLNDNTCSCTSSEVDPRWDALRNANG